MTRLHTLLRNYETSASPPPDMRDILRDVIIHLYMHKLYITDAYSQGARCMRRNDNVSHFPGACIIYDILYIILYNLKEEI